MTERAAGSVPTRHILLAEDSAMMASLIEDIASSAGFKVTRVENGHEALAALIANRDRFDLLLSDNAMPHMGGIELFGSVRARFGDLPFVMMTVFVDEALEAIVNQLDGLLLKPFSVDAFCQAVRIASQP